MKNRYGLVREQMTMETFERVMEQIAHFPEKLKNLSLTGHGEPLLNRNIADMVRMAKERNVSEHVEIISNGSLLTRETADHLIEAGLDCLRISVQGVTAKKYKEICGYNLDFDEFTENIRYFYAHKNKTEVFVKTLDVALEQNEAEIFYDAFQDISDRMYIEQCKPVYDGVDFTRGMRTTMDRYGRLHEKRDVCPLCFFMLGIFPNGDVEPCDTLYKPIILGNVHEKTLWDMFHGEPLRDFRMTQLEKRRFTNEKCAVCCAPDDVSHPEDDLDEAADAIIKRM
jgi:radical SAM protein with 4Fe4S-binding SPASM domain